jgi:hypothetical protein
MRPSDGNVRFLGHRWADTEALEPVEHEWASHYAVHSSFPVPRSLPVREGEGVLVIDAAEFAAVQTALAYRGDWIFLAFLPDVFAIGGEYAVRLKCEAAIYGGLRDLELQAVSLGGQVRSLFVLDTPGHELPAPELSLLAGALWDVREEWKERVPGGRWPPRCRTTGLRASAPDTAGSGAGWERWGATRDGSPSPPAAAEARTEARVVGAGPETLFRSGETWISVGAARPLSDFTVARTYFHSFRLVTGPPPSAWPEPGLDSEEPRRRFLSRYLAATPSRGEGVDGLLSDLARRASLADAVIPDDLPAHVRAWIGRADWSDA